MLSFVTASMIHYVIDAETKVYNLSSYMQAEQLNLLPPFVMEYDEYTFDMNYYNYIFSNDLVFMELMKVMMDIYSGIDVCILIHDDDTHWFVAESLQKVIQERYGVISYIFKDMNDLDFKLNTNSCNFTQEGILTFDNDKMRYLQLVVNQNGGGYY